jgi:hypothetical protein
MKRANSAIAAVRTSVSSGSRCARPFPSKSPVIPHIPVNSTSRRSAQHRSFAHSHFRPFATLPTQVLARTNLNPRALQNRIRKPIDFTLFHPFSPEPKAFTLASQPYRAEKSHCTAVFRSVPRNRKKTSFSSQPLDFTFFTPTFSLCALCVPPLCATGRALLKSGIAVHRNKSRVVGH